MFAPAPPGLSRPGALSPATSSMSAGTAERRPGRGAVSAGRRSMPGAQVPCRPAPQTCSGVAFRPTRLERRRPAWALTDPPPAAAVPSEPSPPRARSPGDTSGPIRYRIGPDGRGRGTPRGGGRDSRRGGRWRAIRVAPVGQHHRTEHLECRRQGGPPQPRPFRGRTLWRRSDRSTTSADPPSMSANGPRSTTTWPNSPTPSTSTTNTPSNGTSNAANCSNASNTPMTCCGTSTASKAANPPDPANHPCHRCATTPSACTGDGYVPPAWPSSAPTGHCRSPSCTASSTSTATPSATTTPAKPSPTPWPSKYAKAEPAAPNAGTTRSTPATGPYDDTAPPHHHYSTPSTPSSTGTPNDGGPTNRSPMTPVPEVSGSSAAG